MSLSRHPALLLGALVLLASCGDDTPTNALPSELLELKTATASYRNITAARAAGYDTPITTCWYDHTQGGMGYHYARTDLIDATPDLLNPEALMYEPHLDGTMQLVGMEYIVPIDAWSGSIPPNLVGQDYLRFDDLGVYALHIHLWKNNPAGLYAPWNPDVTCQYAEESDDMAAAGALRAHSHVM